MSLDLSYLCHQETGLIAIKFRDWGNPVDVSDQVFSGTQKGRESRLSFAPANQLTVTGNHHFEKLGRCPIFFQQAGQDRLEVFTDLHGTDSDST